MFQIMVMVRVLFYMMLYDNDSKTLIYFLLLHTALLKFIWCKDNCNLTQIKVIQPVQMSVY